MVNIKLQSQNLNLAIAAVWRLVREHTSAGVIEVMPWLGPCNSIG
jgi:hypothetical protein